MLDSAPAPLNSRAPSAPARCPHGVLDGRPCWSCLASDPRVLRDEDGAVVECRACCSRIANKARPATSVVDGSTCCDACADDDVALAVAS